MSVHIFGSRRIIVALLISVLGIIPTCVDAQSQGSCRVRRKIGTCVPIYTCTKVVKFLEKAQQPFSKPVTRFLQSSRCEGSPGIHICCDPNSVNSSWVQTTTQTPSIVRFPRARGLEHRESIEAGMRILELTNCGESGTDRISNGNDANLSEFPWMAILIYDNGLGERSIMCGGSLITEQYVLTAAHCIRTERNLKLVRVRLGEHNTRTSPDCVGRGTKRRCAPKVQEIDIEEAVYHEDYSSSLSQNDIGLIRLKSKLNIRSNVKPICLPISRLSNAHNANDMIIAGWGFMENRMRASILQKAAVPIKDNAYCQQIHKIIPVTNSHLCAGGEKKIDTCTGDSGGPLFCESLYQRQDVRWVQYAIISGGAKVCGTDYPGIYTRLTSYLSWIAAHIRS